MMGLLQAARKAKELEGMAKSNPMAFFRPSPPQRKVFEAPHSEKVVLFRAGNQLGKTMCGAMEILFYMFGKHPYKPIPGKVPIVVWVIVHSWEQSKIIQSKVHSLVPPNEYASDSPDFQEGRGYRAKNPWFKLKNGSMLFFKTANQGTLGAASGTIDMVWCDEPMPQTLFGELVLMF